MRDETIDMWVLDVRPEREGKKVIKNRGLSLLRGQKSTNGANDMINLAILMDGRRMDTWMCSPPWVEGALGTYWYGLRSYGGL